MLRAVIIDDEEAGIKTLKYLLDKYAQNSVKVIGQAVKAIEGVKIIEYYKPDVVFLDISMPILNGFQLLDKLTYRDFKLVFTTAHRDYAIQAIKNGAYDYLLKPIDPDDLKSCIDKLTTIQQKNNNENKEKSIALTVRGGILNLDPKDIIRIEADGSYSIIYCDHGVKHLVSKVLKEFETNLDDQIFMRCHKSHIINRKKVVKMINKNGFFAEMRDGSIVNISRGLKDEFVKKLNVIS